MKMIPPITIMDHVEVKEGKYFVDLDRLRSKLTQQRESLTKSMTTRVVVQGFTHTNAYFGAAEVRSKKHSELNNVLVDAKESAPIRFDKDGKNIPSQWARSSTWLMGSCCSCLQPLGPTWLPRSI